MINSDVAVVIVTSNEVWSVVRYKYISHKIDRFLLLNAWVRNTFFVKIIWEINSEWNNLC
jgi:hypothetical protein